MQADTKAISIDAEPAKVVRFLAHPENLPRWAIGFAKRVRSEGGRWFVKTGAGELGLRIDAEEARGVVDFWISPAPALKRWRRRASSLGATVANTPLHNSRPPACRTRHFVKASKPSSTSSRY